MSFIEVEHLSKHFIPPLSFSKLLRFDFRHNKPIRSLENVSFSVKRGKVLGILGPNGAGKTTLLKIIATLILPDRGKVIIDNNKIGQNDEKIKSLIGLAASEERSFYWRLTGIQNLEYFACLYDLNKSQTKSRINQLFELLQVDYADRRFGTYSEGMKRKLALIRALLHRPEILLLDEPTKSLDYNSACHLQDFIKNEANKGKTVILATHNIEEAENLCDHFMVLYQGRVQGFGTLEELGKRINSPSASLQEIYLKYTEND